MKRAFLAALLFGWIGPTALPAQEASLPKPDAPSSSNQPDCQILASPPASGDADSTPDEGPLPEVLPWQSVWGLADLRIIPAGPKTAPNGQEYHPNFSMDLDLNGWLWRSHRLYLFGDARFWGEKPEYGVTNSRDGFFGTSKRQFDLSGGAAWNYAGSWEARVSGYSFNNLNRGTSLVTPAGVKDGCCFENRYYLSPEYGNLGQTGFDVARATFLSVGYYPSKDMEGNDGLDFQPGLLSARLFDL